MKSYLIGYDLNKAGQDYSALIKAIESYGTWWHELDSTWVIKTNQTAEQIHNYLWQFMDSNDQLFAVNFNREAAWEGMSDEGTQWLQGNL